MIDMHIHTDNSDGSSSINEVLRDANKLELTLISITDHNSVKAYEKLNDPEIRRLFKGEIITGCEITTAYNGEVIEVLGYGFDLLIMKELLSNNVLTFEQKQIKEAELIDRQFKKIGLKFNSKNIKFNPKKESSRVAFCNEIKKYPENFVFFLEKKSVESNTGFSRNEVFNPKSPLYVDETSLYPSLEKTIEMIHQAGGFAFLAHPFSYSPTIVEEIENITNIYNLDGIECYYTTFTNQEISYLLDYCNQNQLYKCGGSDYHGANKVNHNLGVGNGNMKISENLIADWHQLDGLPK